jgi:hypothetical protein
MGDVDFLKHQIVNKLGNAVFRDISTYVRGRNLVLWGGHQPEGYANSMLIFALTKFVLGWSYNRMIETLNTNPPLNAKTLNHNCRLLMHVLADWASELIFLGERNDWDAAAAGVPHVNDFGPVRFWIDSSDFYIIRGPDRHGDSEHWSGKEGRPARRYMVLSTADGIIRKIWPAYSPKRYDSDKVRDHRDFFDSELRGVAIVGDNHFYTAREYLRHAIIVVPSREADPPRNRADRASGEIGNAEIVRNRKIRALRARVETSFAMITNKVESLKGPFWEDEFLQDDVVTFAAGVHNYVKQLRQ